MKLGNLALSATAVIVCGCAPFPEETPPVLLSVAVAPDREEEFFAQSERFADAQGFLYAKSHLSESFGVRDAFQAAGFRVEMFGAPKPLSEEYEVGFHRSRILIGVSKTDVRFLASKYAQDLGTAGFLVRDVSCRPAGKCS